MRIFKDLEKQLEDNKIRWEKIDQLIKELGVSTLGPGEQKIFNLLNLIIEQLRPVTNPGKIEDILSDFVHGMVGKK